MSKERYKIASIICGTPPKKYFYISDTSMAETQSQIAINIAKKFPNIRFVEKPINSDKSRKRKDQHANKNKSKGSIRKRPEGYLRL